ncbi:hypothetical protein OROMI_004394 [Orobanche minor]
MSVKEKRDSPISPALIKFGVALAFSLGGIVCTFLRITPSKSKPSLPSPGKGSEADSRRDSGASGLQNSITGDTDGFLLQEVDHLINEHNMAVRTNDGPDDVLPPRKYKHEEDEECDVEIKNLSNKVKILEEREKILEIQLLEYYGLKEQETAVTELQNRLRIHNMEAKLYNLKIESLQSDNRILEAQLADYEKVVTELGDAKAKIKLLRKKLRSEAEQNREQILRLQEKVMMLQDGEKNDVRNDRDVEMQLRRIKELEEEMEETKKTNEGLKIENSELTHKLDYLQMLAPSALDDKEIQALKEERRLLRQQIEDLTKEIEQLRADRCTDIEELVYLRWINACLRYEMRNYQPGPGETIARDLSKTLSPKSEEKAKRLILDYANKEGPGDQGINIIDFDWDQWSASQASYFTDSCEPDDLPANKKTNKTKVFAKLMKLLRGKDSSDPIQTRPSTFGRDSSVDDDIDISGHFCNFGADGVINTIRTSSVGSSANSIEHGHKTTTGKISYGSQRASDDGSLSMFRKVGSITGDNDDLSLGILTHQDAQNGVRTKLLNYAEALKKSRAVSSSRHRSSSYSSI